MHTPHAVFGLLVMKDCKNRIAAVAAYRRRTGLGLPGGRVLSGETPEAALIRKFEQETGLPGVVVGPMVFEGQVEGNLVRTYLVDCPSGVAKEDWATPDELLEAQAQGELRNYNLSVLLAGGFPLASLKESAWIACLGSGTLQRSKEAKAAFTETYLHERTAFELGPSWNAVTTSRVTQGRAMAMSDTPEWTEALWMARQVQFAGPPCLRLQSMRPEWVTITEDESSWEGLALVATPRDLLWWPTGRVAVAKLARWVKGAFVP